MHREVHPTIRDYRKAPINRNILTIYNRNWHKPKTCAMKETMTATGKNHHTSRLHTAYLFIERETNIIQYEK